MKKILIIGATSDIGSAIASHLSELGYTLILTGRNGKKLQQLEAKLSSDSGIFAYKHDIIDITSNKKIYQKIKKAHRSLDWIIYAIGRVDKKEQSKDIENLFMVNTFAMNDVLSCFEKSIQKYGGVISISSTAGIWGNSDYPLYSSSKAALNVLIASTHKKWLLNGRYAFSVCPGPTNTKMRERIAKDSNLHQPATAVAKGVALLIEAPNNFKKNSIYVVKNNTFSQLTQEIYPVL